jgi:hypothetical protein
MIASIPGILAAWEISTNTTAIRAALARKVNSPANASLAMASEYTC